MHSAAARLRVSVVQPIEQPAQVVVHVAPFEKDASHVDSYSSKLARLSPVEACEAVPRQKRLRLAAP